VILHVKRLDLLHPETPGNKFFKLKYNLAKAKSLNAAQVVTVGGPYSNHLHATANACKAHQLPCIGIVRGEEPKQLSPTLQDCRAAGMRLMFMPRADYDECNTAMFKQQVHDRYPRSYFIPEGGNNYLGVNGCMEILNDHDRSRHTLAVPVGTGTTLAGLLLTSSPRQRVLAFPALNDYSLPNRLRETLFWALVDDELADELAARVEWVYAFTFGGFARTTDVLDGFIDEQAASGLPLDRVYTAKMIYGLHAMAAEQRIKENETVLAIHTGGLQGNRK
jgi:1-aminocyclopropane-1-carboxylate deaminase/D-cysteine desulfhydrase-like pyridoxal-dependent ACC family enzyme